MSEQNSKFAPVKFTAPFNKEVSIEEMADNHEYPLLQIRIKEGSRFTTMDLDPDTALKWANIMRDWALMQDSSFLHQPDLK